MDKGTQARGTQDVTVIWIVFVLLVIGLIAMYWYMLYKPKTEEIAAVQASIKTKEGTLETYKTEASKLLVYEDEFAALVHAWNGNQHFFVNGLEWDPDTGTYAPPFKGKEQWAIFETLTDVFQAANFAGVRLTEMYVSEGLKFYMNDIPFEVPRELTFAIGWEPLVSDRGENTNPMFVSHNFAVKFYGDMKKIRRFIEVLQNPEGKVKKIFTIHCFETADKPAYTPDIVGFSDVVLIGISLEIDMMLSVYEMNPEAKTPNTPPDIPGQASCSYSKGGGGGGRRGGGGGGGGGMGTGGLSLGT